MAEVQALLQALSEQYQSLQQELQTSVESRQKLEGQRQENEGVQREFQNLGEDETIYKLIGPILLKQDKVEAESTVTGRIDYIRGEISRLEGQIRDTQDKLDDKRTQIIQAQAGAQAATSQTSKEQVAH